MDKQDYQDWWPLHLRLAKGETLNSDERTVYEACLRQLDIEEAESFQRGEDLEHLRDLRGRVLAAETEHQRLSKTYETMRAEMARFEALLDERTRHALGIGS
ncbi:MAG: hypothetical protein JWN14_4420 [Chthonomonadales bacterium]|nr:hypothetical protein [Chthonomonadales bacterium]